MFIDFSGPGGWVSGNLWRAAGAYSVGVILEIDLSPEIADFLKTVVHRPVFEISRHD